MRLSALIMCAFSLSVFGDTLPPGTYIKVLPEQVFVIEAVTPDPNDPVVPPPIDCDVTPDDPSCPPIEPPVEPDPNEPTLGPIAVDDSYMGKWGNVLSNDIGGGSGTARNARESTNGSVTLKADGSFVIADDAGTCGPGSFKYRVKTPDGLYSNYAKVTLTDICAGPEDGVGPPIDPPVDPNEPTTPPVDPGDTVIIYPYVGPDDPDDPLSQWRAVAVDDNWEGQWGSLIENDLVATGSRIIDKPAHGVIDLNKDGMFTIAPNDGYCGPDTFTYRADNQVGVSNNVATVQLGDICAGPAPVVEKPQCVAPYCPEVASLHIPDFPELGNYSVDGVCQAIANSESVEVTLQDNEPMSDAVDRLVAAGGADNGIINIPWNVNTVQCDSFGFRSPLFKNVTVRGILGPNGEMPRFYCRSVKRGGTMGREGGGNWLGTNQLGDLKPGEDQQPLNVLVENIEVDGYGTIISLQDSGKMIVRNNYLHSTTRNAVSGGTIDSETPGNPTGVRGEFCGNEISHAGQGNTEHCLYIKRSMRPGSDVDIAFVDNLVHSCNWSSGFKSLANKNLVSGNKFYKTKPVKGLDLKYSQVSVDVVSCSKSIVENNYFSVHQYDRNAPENAIVDFVQRRGLFGCDEPRPGPYGTSGARDPVPDYSNPYWSKDYWDSLNGERIFTSYVKNNTFHITGFRADRQKAVRWRGTYPAYTYTLGGNSCLLPYPDGWYERSLVVVENNKFNQADTGELYQTAPPVPTYVFGEPTYCNKEEGPAIPPPDPRDFSLPVQIGNEYSVPMPETPF